MVNSEPVNAYINTYFFYILIGLSYPVVKVIYYLKDLVCINGVIYGTIIGVLTISAGILAFREYKKTGKPIGHWLAALIPLISIPIMPVPMVIMLGSEMFQPGYLSVLIIFVGLAVAQIYCAVLMFNALKTKRANIG